MPFRFFETPVDIDRYWQYASSPDIYSDSGINAHLPTLRSMAESIPNCRILELGIGGGDQSTVAWLAAKPQFLMCVDVNEPDTLAYLKTLAARCGVCFRFEQCDTRSVGVSLLSMFDILFIDTLHDAATVKIELERFAPLAQRYIAFHDTVSFGWNGQSQEPGVGGILLPIADFLIHHPEWSVIFHSDEDNGLLILQREAK